MADQGLRTNSHRFEPHDEIDEVFARASPNPTRADCPTREALIALARQKRSIGDPAYEHLAMCSECYRDFRVIQQGSSRSDPRRPALARTGWLWIAAAVAVVLIAVTIGRWLFVGEGRSRQSDVANYRVEIDLRPYALTRGVEQRGDLPPLRLPHSYGTLMMVLPTGSEAGRYDVQIVDSRQTARAFATGDAELRDHVTTLRVTLDLGTLPRGSYQLAIRRDGQAWQMFPAQAP